ncbi:MAG: hypothetical protein RIS84_1615 [Pseudomonadota bacterium]
MQFLHPTYWHWWAFGSMLLILEILLPGAFFIWIGIAAIALGFLVMFMPYLSFESQLFIYSIIALIAVILGRAYFAKNPIQSEQPLLNERTVQYLGRVFTVVEPIIDGRGKVQIDGSFWRVEGEDCPEGTRVKIVKVSGMHLEIIIVHEEEPTPSSTPE